MKKVFIDGKAGTTGLRIYERLAERSDLQLLLLSDEERKNPDKRKEMLNRADLVFLCLPDAASIEAVSMLENPDTVVLDTSTAHRTEPGWAYGFPELGPDMEEKIMASKRIAVPGCHAGGFIALVRPLIEAGLLAKDALLTCHSLTGYSGGGKSMIAQYEAPEPEALLKAPRQYGITQSHKHLKEMKAITGLETAPLFCPIVADFYSGMESTVPLFASQVKGSMEDIKNVYKSLYTGPVVTYGESAEGGFLSAAAFSGKDCMEIGVYGNDDRILLTARYDNLGKGASGAAVELMNLKLGQDRTCGLAL